ncbi:MAG TPA: HD domain-containing protein, partial [Dehalococcoidia bacterium]|nr:HD domain-containing protein [Dehalococcoidia bacterium]
MATPSADGLSNGTFTPGDERRQSLPMIASGHLRARVARGLYRSRQVFHALWPRIDAAELEAALAGLTAGQRALFLGMDRGDQRHALEVLRRLGPASTDPDLRLAALLHDCGKGRVPVWLR